MKKSELQQIIQEELETIITEISKNKKAVDLSGLVPVLRCLRSAHDILNKNYDKYVNDKSKTPEIIQKETNVILAKYGLKKLSNFDQLYTARTGRTTTEG